MKCKNCNERVVGCHDRCKHYLIFREKLEKAKAKKEDDYNYMCYLSESIIRMKGSRR